MEKIAFKGWEHCYRLSNGLIELVVTGDVGPRIIHLGLPGQENEFCEYEEWSGATGGDTWRNYGGHRLWHAPEMRPRTYAPDNAPVIVEEHGDFVRFSQPVEASTGIQKELDIAVAPDAPRATVTHRLRNINLWAVEFAPWALSVMAQGGVAVIPLPPRGSHSENLLPTGALALWAYTDLTDPRWTLGRRYILLRQDPQATAPQKIGALVSEGWAAYVRDGHCFIKTFDYTPGAAYPDLGVNMEAFTNGRMLEVETLGPLVKLSPGAAVEHVERWTLFADVPAPANDADVETYILPLLK